MGRTKKVGSAGRFGARYGKKIREKVAEIEKVQKRRHICPSCKMEYLVRRGSGIWVCKKCGGKFAGQAYYPPRVI
ncbi:MAG: 50S ribosomal protein L37ae [Candidatus Aenigmarchaeota archaeon]|nr:50S ribosomal protein L37ae [Candidatus Aenigmarchaeota archaeon]MCX8190885.1 50S ribosomal protein L37ae [Candidatus Aenigmarchaeota archaeon]MDW8159888.1 50S ribosomal protein L37ae [Candidatus Aenigmarchaeota archaeon]